MSPGSSMDTILPSVFVTSVSMSDDWSVNASLPASIMGIMEKNIQFI